MSEEEIRIKVLSEILDKFQPEKVYLLPPTVVEGQDSPAGLEFLVIVEKPASRQLTRNFRPGVDTQSGYSIDIRYMTLEEFNSSKESLGRMAHLAATKGRLLHDKLPQEPAPGSPENPPA
jgi:hypothetical protein